MYQKCFVKAEYRTCCFCNKLVLPEGKKHFIKPRMRIKKIFDDYAKRHNLIIVQYGGTSNYSAIATSNFKCKHNDKQFIGLTLSYCDME